MSGQPITSLGAQDSDRIRQLLDTFVTESGARCAFLLDRTGRPLTSSGHLEELDQTSFASLAAADFDASDELAGLLGEAEFTALYHQGVNGSMYLSGIAGAAILAALFDRRTTLGMVRLKTREVLPRLEGLLTEMAGRPRAKPGLDTRWTEDAVSEIDRLFAG